jgi:hypothetical protein
VSKGSDSDFCPFHDGEFGGCYRGGVPISEADEHANGAAARQDMPWSKIDDLMLNKMAS